MEKMTAALLLHGIGDADSRPALQQVLIDSVVTDSRKACPGSLFVAIRGERSDGHDYAAQALAAGAALVLGQRPLAEMPGVTAQQ